MIGLSTEQGEELVMIPKGIIESFRHQGGDPIIDVCDGKTYKTVQIGEQCWLAQNLNFQIEDDKGEPCFYYYDDNEANGDTYGALYRL